VSKKKGKAVVLFEALQHSDVASKQGTLSVCKGSPARPKVCWKKMIGWHTGAPEFYLLTYNERKTLRLNLEQPLG